MKRKIFCFSLILCLALVIGFASIFSTHNVASAENVDVQVSLADDSLLTAYGDCFAYTNSKSIFIAKNNKLLRFDETAEFDKFLDIAMNSTHILALVQNGSDKYLWAYEYNDVKIAKYSYEPTNLNLDYIVGIYAGENKKFFAMETNKVNEIYLNPSDGDYASKFPINTGLPEGSYKDVKDFVVVNTVLFCIIDGDLYVINESDTNTPDPDLSKFRKKIGEYIGISVIDNNILLLSADGVYQYNTQDSSVTALAVDGLDANSKICSATDSQTSTKYVYTKSNLNAVSMYVYANNNLEYYGCFDNSIYTHPTEFELIKLYKASGETILYSSPRHLQRIGVIPQNSYFIALSEQDDFIYVYYHDESEDKTQYGYIKKNANVTLCPATNDGTLGTYAQLLHNNTPIYKYPFEGVGSEKLIEGNIYMQLIVIDNVGKDGNFTWGWYKVGFVDENNNTHYGYVKAQNLSPYTQLTAPALSKSAKLTSKKLGQYIKIYALPFDEENGEDAIEVAELPEGTSVYLKEKFNKKSTWTAIYYEGKTAYVYTKNVNASSLTPWQLTLAITIPCVVVALAIAITLIVLAKKKKQNYRSNI